MTQNRDLLLEPHQGLLSVDEVWDLYDRTEPAEAQSAWGLSKVEWTAPVKAPDLKIFSYNIQVPKTPMVAKTPLQTKLTIPQL